jgi:16S rRNA (guanine527-N7)-methyltransferase
LSPDATPEATLSEFLRELARWGERMNLVGSTDSVAMSRHVDDALAAVPHLPQGLSVVDLGSGAGFPGLPIAIARRDLRVSLVEIREKRVAFLRHVVRTLELDVAVRRESIEDAPSQPYDIAFLRAVAAPERSVELARPWVGDAGEIWVWAGPDVDLPGSRPIALASGGAILRVPVAVISRGTR